MVAKVGLQVLETEVKVLLLRLQTNVISGSCYRLWLRLPCRMQTQHPCFSKFLTCSLLMVVISCLERDFCSAVKTAIF